MCQEAVTQLNCVWFLDFSLTHANCGPLPLAVRKWFSGC